MFMDQRCDGQVSGENVSWFFLPGGIGFHALSDEQVDKGLYNIYFLGD